MSVIWSCVVMGSVDECILNECDWSAVDGAVRCYLVPTYRYTRGVPLHSIHIGVHLPSIGPICMSKADIYSCRRCSECWSSQTMCSRCGTTRMVPLQWKRLQLRSINRHLLSTLTCHHTNTPLKLMSQVCCIALQLILKHSQSLSRRSPSSLVSEICWAPVLGSRAAGLQTGSAELSM